MKSILYTLAGMIFAAVGIVLLRYSRTSYYKLTHTPYLNMRCSTGKYGEYLIYKVLRRYEREGGRFLFNLYLPKPGGETTELDVVLLCRGGIFVFESKNYSGWIYGRESDYTWTQILPYALRDRDKKFYNPILQNRGHLKHLQNLVGEDVPLHSVIVFSERCMLKKVKFTRKEVRVIKRSKLRRTVKRICAKHPDVLDDTAIQELYSLLYPYTQVRRNIKTQHIKSIRRYGERDDGLRCPYCGGSLVLRTASRGENAGEQFYGCENYPRCRFTQDAD